MVEIVFEPRYALEATRNPDLSWLRGVILNPFQMGGEFGEATITFREGAREATLILISDRELGYYLKHEQVGDIWLSLGDPDRLTEVVCPDDWKASAGLFIPLARAWMVIHEFLLSGTRSAVIGWIQPSDVPESGNW